jgi:hypothetical protein
MKSRSRKLRITLEENVAGWLYVEAARNNISVSDCVSEILKERMSETANYEAAKVRALARKPFLKTEGRYATREETHERSV